MKDYDSKVVNGNLLRSMIISGANNLFNHYPEVDALNVFPVPDGDTGTNMNLTITSGSKEIMNLNTKNVYDVAKSFSRGLLMGARGNSGVILSQIFRGFAQGLAGKEEASIEEFALAWKKGAEVAYKAVMKPVEGTILTVIRESAEELMDRLDEIDSIGKAMEVLLERGRTSLAHTPELLPVLKEVGVVDSGGSGLVYVFEGILFALKGEVVERKQVTISRTSDEIEEEAKVIEEEKGYCVEFILKLDSKKKKFNQERVNTILESAGRIIRLTKTEDEIQVCVHTQKPGVVINLSQPYGEFTEIKVENMENGHHHFLDERKIEPEKPKEWVEMAVISTSVGEGLNALFKSLNVDYVVSGGQTMNPSTEDFVEAIKTVHARNVFILPNNKNIVMAAEQACMVSKDCKCYVIPTTTIPQGLVACMVYNPEDTAEDNETNMRESIGGVKSGQITFSIKDTKIDGVNIKKDEFMGIFNGKIVNCHRNKNTTLKELVKKMIDEDSSIVTIIYGEDVSESEVQLLADYISEKYSIEVEVHNGGQPVYSYFVGVE